MLGKLSPVPHIDSKEFERLIALNLVANQRLLAAFDPMLRLGMSPRVIALTASVAASPRPYWGAYGASKAALENLILTYAEEVKNLSDIRVAIVDPGATARSDEHTSELQSLLRLPYVVFCLKQQTKI